MMGKGIRRVGGALWRVLFPYAAMKKTVSLAQREIERNKENIAYIKELRQEAGKALRGSNKGAPAQLGFEEALASRADGALDISDLQRAFVRRKRWALGAGFLFSASAVVGIAGGVATGQFKQVLLSLGSMTVALPMFFLIAMSAQHRLWQLAKRRLSLAERGGVEDFWRETERWWLLVLNPSDRASKECRHAV